jgi:hypothetical protein
MTPKELTEFVNLSQNTDLSYNEVGKARFHQLGKKVLRDVAKRLGLVKGTYDLRSNLSGIACSGEIVLHSETLYIQLSQSALGNSFGFFYRSCRGRKDYTGGCNNWMKWDRLLGLDKAIEDFKRVMKTYEPFNGVI